jgi:hypothetical protein
MPYRIASKERGNIVLMFARRVAINKPLLLRNISFLASNTGPHDVVSLYAGVLCRQYNHKAGICSM